MNNENKNTGALAIALVLCLIVLVILVICVYEKFTSSTPTVTPDDPDDKQYVTISNLTGMNLTDAKAMLDDAEIIYEVVHTDSELYNKVLNVEYTGKTEGENLLIPLKEKVSEQIYSKDKTLKTDLRIATLGNDAGIIGAAAFANDR